MRHRFDAGGRATDDRRQRHHRTEARLGSFEERPPAEHAAPNPSEDTPTLETGTTIVAMEADESVVMAADQRMSLGGRLVANKDAQKIESVHPTAAMAIAGSVGPAQDLLRSLSVEARLYETRRGRPMRVSALAEVAGGLVRGAPVAPLLGGVDDAGAHVFQLDGSGSVMADRYAAGGSGMQLAYGVLEDRFEPDAPTEEAVTTATAAVEAASERDTASGDGVTLAVIDRDGVRFETGGAS
ncbi:proteasome subunit beta [Halopiger goleimassiliensis]|uniref:proteasome subunit beta n=1 Tax=Halopiger goleimassiliensis TaxID=1293048 RepID=UPI0009DC434D|nr:proteasome subunit beta [Halopiger goleimassiliensis]